MRIFSRLPWLLNELRVDPRRRPRKTPKAETLRLEKTRRTHGSIMVGGHLHQNMGIVADTGSTGVGGPSIGLGDRPGCEILGDEGMQAAVE